MRRTRTFGLGITAALGAIALLASTAAALPEVGRCMAKAAGNYTDANCTVKHSGHGSFEFVKGAVRDGFTESGGQAVLEGAAGTNFVCTNASATGKYDADGTAGAIKGVEAVIVRFINCSIPTVAIDCRSEGAASGEIVTDALSGILGYISGEKTGSRVVGQELTPEVKNGPYATINCGGGAVIDVLKAKTSNCIIATASPANVFSTTFEEAYASSENGHQAPTHFQRTPTKLCQLEASVNGGKSELVGQRVEMAVTNEEPLELHA